MCEGIQSGYRSLRLSVGRPEKHQGLSGGNLIYRSYTGGAEPPRRREKITPALRCGVADGLSALRAGAKNSRGVRQTLGPPRRAADLSRARHGGKRREGVACDARRPGTTGEALPAAARGVFAEALGRRR